jgi:hypothetical protein
VITDHHSLIWLSNLKDPTGRLSRWALQLQHHDYTIEHRPGKLMVVPDALSRAFATESESENSPEVAAVQKSPSWFENLKADVMKNPEKFPDYRIENEALMRHIRQNTDITKTNWRIVVEEAKLKEILKDCLDNAAHLGYTKTYARLCERT